MTPSTPATLSSLYASGGDASLSLSWHDSAWIPILNAGNVVDYFCQRSNPFYDRTCNNEVIRMQRLDPRHVTNMAGVEYILIHAQEPVLYVIRKQRRHNPVPPSSSSASRDRVAGVNMVTTPLADYYIVAGIVYKSPDLGSVLNSRCFTALHACQSAFATALQSRDQTSINAESCDDESGDEVGSGDRWHGVDRAEIEMRAAHLRRVDSIIDQLTRKPQMESIDNHHPAGVVLKSSTESINANVVGESKVSVDVDNRDKTQKPTNNSTFLSLAGKVKEGSPPLLNSNTLSNGPPTKPQITASALNTISNKKNKPN